MMTTDKNAGSVAGDNGDNLEAISGIGPKTAEALAHIGVKRLADLAQSTPEGLAKALLDQLGFRVSPKHIEAQDWIGQAQARVQQSADEQVAQHNAVEAESQSDEQPEVHNILAETQWQQHAGFSLFFDYVLDEEGKQNWQTRIWQTRVYHDETAAEQLFPGIAPGQWANWILQHADLPTDVEAGLVEAQTAKISIVDVQVELKTGPGLSAKKLVAAIQVAATGANAEMLATTDLLYQILLHTVELESGATALVAAERSQFQPGQIEYAHQLEFPIPNVGRYEVQCIFLGSAPAELLASYRGPIIRVTP